MDNEEFKTMISSGLKAIAVIIAICIPIAIFYFNKYKLGPTTNIIKSFREKETFLIYVYEKEDQDILNTLKDVNVKYYVYDLSKERSSDLLDKINLEEEDIKPWALIYIKKGTMASNINKYNDIEGFLEYNNLIKE